MGFQSRTKGKIGDESANGKWKGVPDIWSGILVGTATIG